MELGELDITVRRVGDRVLFHVRGTPYGQETETTPRELTRLGRFLVAEAEQLQQTRRSDEA
jgi:hypothetical protein